MGRRDLTDFKGQFLAILSALFTVFRNVIAREYMMVKKQEQ